MAIRFFHWFIQKLGAKTLGFVFLLLVAVGSGAFGLAEVIKGLESGLLFRIVFLAIITSWLLARTKMKTWIGGVALFLFGIIVLIIAIGQLVTPLIALFKAADYLIWVYLYKPPGLMVDLTTIHLAYSEVFFGAEVVIDAVLEWISSIIEGLPIYNEIAINLIWGLAMWSIACWAGWVLRRFSQPVLSVLPTGVLLSVTLSYTWAGTESIITLVFATLLLMALKNYDFSEKKWVTAKMDYPEDLSKEFAITSVILVVGIVAIAALLPIFTIDNIIKFAQQFTSPQIEEAEPVIQSFGLQQNTIPREDIGKALRGGFPRGHMMGTGPELEEELVMTVKISGGLPEDAEQGLDLPLYWRSLTYDDYSGFGWRSSDIVIRSYQAGEEVISIESPYHQVIQLDFRMAKGETRFLYSAGEIFTADDDFKIAYRPTLRFTEVLDAHGDFFGASIDQSAFRVQSVIPVIDENTLRTIQGGYPDWINERYLTLTDSVPSRVFRLANDLTQNDLTSYDKARTLEKYLRNFEYTLDVDLPPLRRDMVDYFLFDLQKGYCDYYATAMVVMARSLGIPSRLAIGYYQGTYDEVNRRYIVTEADAHSWAEVYFPQIGWVPFEPTSGRAEIKRLNLALEISEEFDPVRRLRSLSPWFTGLDWNWLQVVIGFFVSILVFILAAFLVDRIRIQSLSTSKAITLLYQRLYRYGRIFGIQVKKWHTPNEFSNILVLHLKSLSADSIIEKPVHQAISDINEFTNIYNLMLYSDGDNGNHDQKWVIRLWRRLYRGLLLARIRGLYLRKRMDQEQV